MDKNNVFAVVGVSKSPEKYRRRVYQDLRDARLKVYPVNPNTDEVLSDKCYPSLNTLPEKPDVVDIVVPPKETEEVVKTCKKLGIKKVWMQPGSESQAAIDYCRKNGIDVNYGICIVQERRKRQTTNLLTSLRLLYVGGPCRVHSGARAFGIKSALGRYGLISIIGEPSRASSSRTVKRHFSTFKSSATHKPIGLGRDGLLQAKTPFSTFTACFLGNTTSVRLSSSLSRMCIQ